MAELRPQTPTVPIHDGSLTATSLADITDSSIVATPMGATSRRNNTISSAQICQLSEELKDVSMAFDKNYTSFSDILMELSDESDAIINRKRYDFEQILSQLEQRRTATKSAEAAAQDNTAIESLFEKAHALEEKKEQIILAMESTQQQVEDIKLQNEDMQTKLQQLSHEHRKWHDSRYRTLPTLTFIQTLFESVSRITLTGNGDPNIIEGYISKTHDKDVYPFSSSAINPSFEEVNQVWRHINE